MAEYIDREAAINAATLAKSDADITLVPGSFTNGFIEGAKIKENAILNALADVPAADVVEARNGKWIEENTRPRSSQFCCSVCHRTAYDPQPTRVKDWKKRCRYAYCPNCGAKMDGGVNDV